jgi:hypothetical protein
MRASYNARRCDGERKAAVPGTMASNEKNNVQSNREQSDAGRHATALRASRRRVDRVDLQDLRMSLGAESRVYHYAITAFGDRAKQ